MATAVGAGQSEWEVAVPEKPLKDKTYFENLKAKVIDTNLCSRCLTCAAICPGGITVVGNKVDFPDYETKCLDCGACVRVCPRFVYEPKSGLGDYIEFIAGRSKRFAGQDGAMVTELLVSAIEMGMIDRGLFAGRDEKWATEMFHVREPEQLAITTLGGTKYTFADVLPALKEAVMFTKRGVGIVGTPCIVSGVRKLQQEYPIFRDRVKLVVGLFCTENFHYDDITKFLQEKGVDFSKLVKTDIIKGKFISTMTDGKVKFKVAEAEDIIEVGANVAATCNNILCFCHLKFYFSIGHRRDKFAFDNISFNEFREINTFFLQEFRNIVVMEILGAEQTHNEFYAISENRILLLQFPDARNDAGRSDNTHTSLREHYRFLQCGQHIRERVFRASERGNRKLFRFSHVEHLSCPFLVPAREQTAVYHPHFNCRNQKFRYHRAILSRKPL